MGRFRIDGNLSDYLRNCIGRHTIEVHSYGEYDFVYHYGALICVYDSYNDIMIFNYFYYDYSNSTGRVRNEALRRTYFQQHAVSKLRKCENKPIPKQLQILDRQCIMKLSGERDDKSYRRIIDVIEKELITK